MKELAMRQILGMPAWVWALVIGLLAINDAIKAARWTRAESFVEALAMSLLRIPVLGTVILARFPVIGWLLRKLAGLEPPPEKPAEKVQGAEPPPPIRSGESGFTLVEILGLAVLAGVFVAGVMLLPGCACNPKTTKVDSATCARQIVTAVDAIDGAAARYTRQAVRSCGDEGKALREAGKLDESLTKYNQCSAMGDTGVRVIVGVEDGAQVASDGIDAGEKAGAKDYGGLTGPLLQLARDGVKALTNQGIKIPAAVTALLGGL